MLESNLLKLNLIGAGYEFLNSSDCRPVNLTQLPNSLDKDLGQVASWAQFQPFGLSAGQRVRVFIRNIALVLVPLDQSIPNGLFKMLEEKKD